MGESSPDPAFAGTSSGPAAAQGRVPVLRYERTVTPKVRIEGAPAAVEQAIALLEPHFGPPHAFAAGIGWNLNRSQFLVAQAVLLARDDPQSATRKGGANHRILVPAGDSPPPTVTVAGRRLRLAGTGRMFRLGKHQAAASAHPALKAGAAARFAYYRP